MLQLEERGREQDLRRLGLRDARVDHLELADVEETVNLVVRRDGERDVDGADDGGARDPGGFAEMPTVIMMKLARLAHRMYGTTSGQLKMSILFTPA